VQDRPQCKQCELTITNDNTRSELHAACQTTISTKSPMNRLVCTSKHGAWAVPLDSLHMPHAPCGMSEVSAMTLPASYQSGKPRPAARPICSTTGTEGHTICCTQQAMSVTHHGWLQTVDSANPKA
jgi:hypothetical protein